MVTTAAESLLAEQRILMLGCLNLHRLLPANGPRRCPGPRSHHCVGDQNVCSYEMHLTACDQVHKARALWQRLVFV